ncbi:flagellar basal body P-ring formation chaperone FlgA [Paracoccus sediminicola]|uniref:flagellar basal body P-ring formation chaperone FlgA n=1 Tax=Paracoccus sediminicola TaxID=3017783 RepID=UPI0022F10C3B|nr:flagellar basal body P-ring formation chaperone FlgA [Paracoccus sediminicola]WBU56938.1 flagellar basal body P-ring formation chaperone FlgA [Paracoccus sediminicola]
MRLLLALILAASPSLAFAGIVASRDLPAGTVIGPGDVTLSETVTAGIADPAQAIGRQARIAIYEGRPVVAGALRDPVLVGRNELVRVHFAAGPLWIETEGRALSEGAEGDVIRVMNLGSRSTISARIQPDGTLLAGHGTGGWK